MNYWNIPEDISPRWGKFCEEIMAWAEKHGNTAMTVGLIVRDGFLLKTMRPQTQLIEPRNGRHEGEAKSWWPIIRRLQSCSAGGEALVIMTVMLNAKGQPVGWTAPERWEVENS